MVNKWGRILTSWPWAPAACILHSAPCDCVPAAAGGPGRPGWPIPAPPAQVHSTLTGSCSSMGCPPWTHLASCASSCHEAGSLHTWRAPRSRRGGTGLRPVPWPLCALATLAFPRRICCVPGWLASPGSCPSVTSSAIMTLVFLHSDIFGSHALALLCRFSFVTIKSVQTLRWG